MSQKEELVRTKEEDGHLSAKERSVKRNQPCRHLDFGCLGPEWKKKNLLKLPSLWYIVRAARRK